MNQPYYADLHHHPGTRNYNKNERNKHRSKSYNPWVQSKEFAPGKAKGKRAINYTQSDLSKLDKSNVKIGVFSLYPMEKGFSQVKIPFLQKIATSIATEYSLSRLNYLGGLEYDYFIELLTEYNYYRSQDRKVNTSHYGRRNAYAIIKDKKDLLDSLESGQVSLVPTIEGIHGLGLGQEAFGGVDVSLQELYRRIEFLRGNIPIDRLDVKLNEKDAEAFSSTWEHCPFFITFAHHFDNSLCGHARSIPLNNSFMFNQSRKLNTNMTAEGKQVIKNLLAIDEQDNDLDNRRILIDTRHLSPLSRRDYYKIVESYNAKNPSHKIPIIMSHSGYSGIPTIDEQMSAESEINAARFKKNKKKVDRALLKQYGFYWWAINLTDEDIVAIIKSEGLIGVSMDQRILGHEAISLRLKDSTIEDEYHITPEKLTRLRKPQHQRLQSIKIFGRTIEAMVEKVYSNTSLSKKEKHSIWDCLTLGSDYDGFIDPLDGFPTCESYGPLEALLTKEFVDLEKVKPEYFTKLKPKDIVRKICYENVKDFLIAHYPE